MGVRLSSRIDGETALFGFVKFDRLLRLISQNPRIVLNARDSLNSLTMFFDTTTILVGISLLVAAFVKGHDGIWLSVDCHPNRGAAVGYSHSRHHPHHSQSRYGYRPGLSGRSSLRGV